MHAPTPDPTDRPSAARQAGGSPSPPPAGGGKGSTGSHRPPPARGPSLSDILSGAAGSSARRPHSHSDVTAHLAAPAGGPTHSGPPDVDDAPTVITGGGKRPGAAAAAPYVVGEAASLAGRRLGHFELIESVGAGGMAAVLKARDLDLNRIVALKILPPESARDPENVTRFKHEARAAAMLDHDNVARVYFCGEDQGLYFIAFEFVEGITLRQAIDRRGPLPPGECVRYMIQVAAGLNHAAERNVVHRDIKPSNIVITPDGRAKIVDMGLARHLDQPVNGGVTQSGVTLGTFDYISPEQALDPRRADVRSDIYSLGCAFYHALTGRPPVADGTAAKKLHAHQNIDPLDPRVLNPAVPDELAAVLSRMMAKDPARRYQTPTDLIAHLKAVGGKLRLSVEAVVSDSAVHALPADSHVLPTPPRVRLRWVTAAAAVAVAAVVIAVSATGPGAARVSPPWAPPAAVAKVDELIPLVGPAPTPGGPPAPVPADGIVRVTTAAELADALARPTAPALRVRLDPGEYDLTKLGRAVAFRGTALELTGSVSPPTRVRVAPATSDPARPGTLTLEAGTVAVQGVRFEFAGTPNTTGVEQAAGDSAGLTVGAATRAEFTDCAFLPDGPARRAGFAAVAVTPPAGDGVRVRAVRCAFGPGVVGVRVTPSSDVAVEDCGFGPHAAAVRVTGAAAPDAAVRAVRLDRSSFMLDPTSAVVEFDPASAAPHVAAGHCVFAFAGAATDGSATPPARRAGAVVRVPGEATTGVKFDGAADRPNAYYRVDPVATAARNYSFDDAAAFTVAAADPARVELRRRPWDAPGGILAPFAGDPWRAFRLRVTGPDADPDLFPANAAAVKILGAQFTPTPLTAGGRAYPATAWPPLNPAADAAVAQKVWWPAGPPDAALKPGVYTDLFKLLRDARHGDTVRIRHTGPLAVDQQQIEPPKPGGGADRGDFHLTFKPDGDSRPVLTPAEVNKLDLSLFRVREGRVTFEGLQFLLKPGRQNETLSAVALVAGRGCTFRNCVLTLDEGDGKVAAVKVDDPSREMMMEGGPRAVPKVVFENCLIRGKGRGLWVPSSRPFDLDMRESITALDGPVIFASAAGRDPGAAGPSAVKLTRVTALLGGPLVELHAGKVGEMRASGLVPTTVTADACLFAAVPGAGRPVVEVDGTDLDPADPKGVLRWERGEANRFANFEPGAAAAVVRPGDGAAHDWTWNTWIQFSKEVGRPVGKVQFARGPAALKELIAVDPGDAAVKAVDFPDLPAPKPADAGATPGKVSGAGEE